MRRGSTSTAVFLRRCFVPRFVRMERDGEGRAVGSVVALWIAVSSPKALGDPGSVDEEEDRGKAGDVGGTSSEDAEDEHASGAGAE